MAFKTDSSDELSSLSEINVTPLVDVMLVLLVIFMITAPLMTQGLTVELPPAEGKSFETATDEPSRISVAADGAVFLDGAAIDKSLDLEISLGSMLRGKKVKKAVLEADKNVAYGNVIAVMDVMNRAGVEQLGMMTSPRETTNAGRRRQRSQ